MPEFNFPRSTGTGFILVMSLAIVLVLTACGDQNPTVVSQGAGAVGVQAPNPASRTSQGQGQLPTTSSPAKTTQKPGATTAKTATGVLHICSLLSKDEAAASLGGTVDVMDAASDALGEFGQANCNYTTSTGGLTVQVSLTDQSKADFEKGFQSTNPQAVSGLGDAAFFLGGQLSTLKGRVVVVIFLLNPAKGSQTLSNATILTQKILAAIGKTSRASDLTSSVAAGTGKQVTAADVPVYPGSVRVNSDEAFGNQIATFTSTDSYATVVNWYKKLISDKSWTGSAALEPEADYTIVSAYKFTTDANSQLSVSIEGPKKADRVAGSDANGSPIVLSPNATLIVVTLSGKQ